MVDSKEEKYSKDKKVVAELIENQIAKGPGEISGNDAINGKSLPQNIVPKVILPWTYNAKPLKDQLLFWFYDQELSTDELVLITNKPRQDLQRVITRADRKDGLLDRELIEYSQTKNGLNYYKATNKGKAIIDEQLKLDILDRSYINQEKMKADAVQSLMEDVDNYLTLHEDRCVESKRIKSDLYIDFYELVREVFSTESITDHLLDKPEEIIELFRAQYNIIHNYKPDIRFTNLPNSSLLSVGEVRVAHLETFIKLKGTPIGVSKVLPKTTSARFECPSCGNIIRIIQLSEDFVEPSRCSCGRKGKFKLLSEEFKNIQILKLEESPEEMGKRIKPQQISVILEQNLTKIDIQHHLEDSKKLIINGILQRLPRNSKSTGRKKSTTYDFIVLANSIELEVEDDIPLTNEELKLLKEISNDPEIKTKIINSFCPEIVDRSLEKEGIILSAVSGGKVFNSSFRDDSHCLLIGEPSIGKSFLMKRLKELMQNCRWVSGNGASGVGLIGSVKKDEQLGEIILSKGVLPMANHGIVIIDEFDKMRADDRLALHEPLENQSVHIDKWDKHAEFRTDCTIIASANPKYSRFIQGNIIEQINLPASLISRFDLIFVLKDIRNRQTDENVAKSILSRFAGEKETTKIDMSLLKKYLNYVKTTEPKLTKNVSQYLERYYVEIRNKAGVNMPFSSRQMEGLIRLTKAGAKLRLAAQTNIDDAERAIKLMNYSLKGIATDDITGGVDVDLIYEGISGTVRTILDYIKINKEVSFEELVSHFTIEEEKLDMMMTKLKEKGDVMLFNNKFRIP
ncbi:MAG: minichromosome maintenance protein MCM [Candidatus Daviesbacteria bacterium]|nr:minichromosome maintenance protein MCM [Candidatus Daviesbacteria bacterium]